MRSESPLSTVRERPLFLPLAAVIAGIASGGLGVFFLPENLFVPLAAVTFLAIFLRSRLPFHLFLFLLLFVWGNLSIQPFIHPVLADDHIVRLVSDQPVTVEGVIDSRPQATERGSKLYLRAEQVFRDKRRARVSGRLLVFVREGMTQLQTGDRVRFASRLQQPRNYGLPGEFDYAGYLAFQNVFVTAFAKSVDDVILIRSGVDYPLQRPIDSLAARIGGFIDGSVARTEGSILRALLIGDMGSVPRAIKDAYSRTGANHILSISGFHVGVIALFMFQLLMWGARTSEYLLLHLNLRRFIMMLTLPLLIFYLFLSGAAPATVRSVIMIGFYILALMLEREVDPINSLMLAAFAILALSPPDLFDISFQLSFLALWGILVLTPLFMTPFRSVREGIPRKLLLFLMASAAATAATTVTVAYYFHRVSVTGLISNFFIVPLMGYGAVVLGFSAVPLVGAAPAVARLLMVAAAFLVTVSNGIIMVLARIPTISVLNPSRLALCCFYLLLTALTFVKGAKGRLFCCGTLACLLAGALALPSGEGTGRLVITMLSVGQGESTLITFPDGKRMLVDGGGSAREGGPDVGERLLAPALWRLGVRTIDRMVLTHPHPDHMQGLKYVAANFTVGEFWEGVGVSGSPDYDELHRILTARQVPIRRITAGSPPIFLGGARIEPLGPMLSTLPTAPEEADLNDESVVFRLTYGDFRMLFTGDIGMATEERLAAHPEQVKCTVLKVPHHGSRYSSSLPFLAAAAPRIALISAGYRNSFHLPAQETLDSFREERITVYRTDLDGTIRVVTDGSGEKVTVETFDGHFH